MAKFKLEFENFICVIWDPVNILISQFLDLLTSITDKISVFFFLSVKHSYDQAVKFFNT